MNILFKVLYMDFRNWCELLRNAFFAFLHVVTIWSFSDKGYFLDFYFNYAMNGILTQNFFSINFYSMN